jgi:alpha-tubulin suppressor-like RCC1 family protein
MRNLRLRAGYQASLLIALLTGILMLNPGQSVSADGGFFTEPSSVAISADQRAIIIRNGDQIAMTFSTGYTGEGEDFAWIIPVPSIPDIADVYESGDAGENAFRLLDQWTSPVVREQPSACFVAGTKVLTSDGLRDIETVERGCSVYARDMTSGNWVLRTVTGTPQHAYRGDIITIEVAGTWIEATGNHPFYVTAGDELTGRPSPQDVPQHEREANSGGRWVEARDLREADVLLTRDGSLVVTAVSRRSETVTVYNLTVEQLLNYAVGPAGVLVHNKSGAEVASPTQAVTVYGTITLEHYEASIVGATGATSLLAWLNSNGYRAGRTATTVLESYVRDNWVFVAVKLNPGEFRDYENEFLPPLSVRYRSDELVFPLRISSVSTLSRAAISLYVIGQSTFSSPNLDTRILALQDATLETRDPDRYLEDCVIATTVPDGNALVTLWKGPCPGSTELIDALSSLAPEGWQADSEHYLSRLEARMGPAGMTQDIKLSVDPEPQLFRVELTAETDHSRARPWNERILTEVSDVDARAHSNHAIALGNDGTVWTWGTNASGQLGDGTRTDRFTPAQVPGIGNVVSVAAGSSFCLALDREGVVWGWGANAFVRFESGTEEDQLTPAPIAGLGRAIAIDAGRAHTVVLQDDGTLMCWGHNTFGATGTGLSQAEIADAQANATAYTVTEPTRVPGLSDVVAIAAGGGHTLALTRNGDVWAWGFNNNGELGVGSTMEAYVPQRIDDLSRITAIAAGSYHSAALARDGTVWTWGSNSGGQLGADAELYSRKRPGRVPAVQNAISITAGSYSTSAVTADGTEWCWGSGAHERTDELGLSASGAPRSGTGWVKLVRWYQEITEAAEVVMFDTIALADDGSVWTFGDVFSRTAIGGQCITD